MAAVVFRQIRHLAGQMLASSFVRPRTQEDRNAQMLYLNTAMMGVAFGGITSFLPVFLARLGASSTLLGWLTSAPALLAVFSLIPGAIIAELNPDQVKVRVTYAQIVRASYLVCALAPFVVPAEYLAVVLVIIWTVKTFPEAVAIPAWMAVMARAISPERRARLNGERWALLSVVSAISSAAFGWMLDSIPFPWNYQLVFFISFATAGLDPYFFSFIRVPPLERPEISPSRNPVTRFVEYLKPVVHHKPFIVFLGATILYRIALNLPAPLFSLFWVNELRASDTLIGLRGTVGNAALVIGYIFWGRSANKMGHRMVLILSALTFATYPIITALSPTAWWLLPAAAVWGLTVSGLDIGLFDLMLASCPQQRQPLFAAVWSMVANAAIFAGPLMGAALSNATSIGVALLIAGALQAITTIPFVFLPKDV